MASNVVSLSTSETPWLITLKCDYHQGLVERMKTLAGCQWDTKGRRWLVPLDLRDKIEEAIAAEGMSHRWKATPVWIKDNKLLTLDQIGKDGWSLRIGDKDGYVHPRKMAKLELDKPPNGILLDGFEWTSNYKNKRTKSLHDLAKLYPLVPRCVVAESFPWEDLSSTWGALEFLYPGLWGTYWKFVKRYVVTYKSKYGWRTAEVRPDMLPELQRRLNGINLIPEPIVDDTFSEGFSAALVSGLEGEDDYASDI